MGLFRSLNGLVLARSVIAPRRSDTCAAASSRSETRAASSWSKSLRKFLATLVEGLVQRCEEEIPLDPDDFELALLPGPDLLAPRLFLSYDRDPLVNGGHDEPEGIDNHGRARLGEQRFDCAGCAHAYFLRISIEASVSSPDLRSRTGVFRTSLTAVTSWNARKNSLA